VGGRSLIRLKLAFVALGVALLLPLALLVRSAAARLEEQRRLKHEVVAERIFDEMERELTQLIEHERSRPSGAYAAANTSAHSWAPFVVGYFTHDAGGLAVTAQTQLSAERAALVASSAERCWRQAITAQPTPGVQPPAMQPISRPALPMPEAPPSHSPPPAASGSYAVQRREPSPSKQDDVLRKLNRAQYKRPPPSSSSPDLQLNPYRNDPLGASQ
jgi:hypothetical protein